MATAESEPIAKNLSNYYAPRDYLQWDMRSGKLTSRGGARVVVFPQEFAEGLVEGLLDECGEAWPVVLYRCGEWWGKRQMGRAGKELASHLGAPLEQFPLALAQTVYADMWATHGWGKLSLDGADLEQGLLHATVEGAPFGALFVSQKRDAKGRPVDAVLAGALAGMFAEASGADIVAHEIACAARGEPACRFVVGTRERVAAVPELLRKKVDANGIIEQLRRGAR